MRLKIKFVSINIFLEKGCTPDSYTGMLILSSGKLICEQIIFTVLFERKHLYIILLQVGKFRVRTHISLHNCTYSLL